MSDSDKCTPSECGLFVGRCRADTPASPPAGLDSDDRQSVAIKVESEAEADSGQHPLRPRPFRPQPLRPRPCRPRSCRHSPCRHSPR
ncbi:uncharacterized protein THITE_2170542 [Thermothielavioides terrestris NRRL 8126]|uniref:Uncharacterized protein n=1 Tax=Thermothielavioides terrestris (strain ATCC 38088 / NRRL 8126) TaxID=578455 RepID=G2R8M2_THETT|nr:uncharacterized protein THITE_2170542 [Thermothielavioides terrestris NRRL 8126]AEO67437.1 hypothetical protein THITE_2170542 [Thermothielavioides terrestris NRRL 8126]